MHGVLTGALQEILGAIERIENPQPLRIERLTSSELLGSGLLTEHSPRSLGEGIAQAIKQVLIDRKISSAHRPLPTVIHAERLGVTKRRLL